VNSLSPNARKIETVLVTGAGGLIGQAVVRAVAADGFTVRAQLGPPGAAVTPAPAGITAAYANIDDGPSIRDLADGVQAIVHLAGPPSVARSFEDPAAYARAHCLGTANILAACGAHRVRLLIYVSSAEVYGRPERNPVSEDAPLAPLSPYAAMKAAAEQLVRICGASYGLQAVVMRPFSVIGAPVSAYSVLGNIISQALEADFVSVQSPEVTRDYVHVDDLAEAIRKSLHAEPRANLRAFNIGTGIGTSVRELAQTVLTLLAKRPDVRATGSMDRPKASDILTLVGDPHRATEELDWQSRVPLIAALESIVDSYRHGREEKERECAL